jgi:hypothetical protein
MTAWRTAPRWGKIGIAVQFLALVRMLGEVYRLRWLRGPGVTLSDVQPFILGALVTAVLCGAAVALSFFGRWRAAAGVAVLNVVVLVGMKIVLLT